jgi:hypothetical protein
MSAGDRVAVFDRSVLRWRAAQILSIATNAALIEVLSTSQWACVSPAGLRPMRVVS